MGGNDGGVDASRHLFHASSWGRSCRCHALAHCRRWHDERKWGREGCRERARFAVRFGSFCSAFRLLLQRRSGSFAAGEANLFATCFRFFALRLSKKRFAERIFSFRNGSSTRTLFFALSNWNSAIYKKYSSLWLKFAGASREIVRNSRKKRHFCLEKVEKYTFQKL